MLNQAQIKEFENFILAPYAMKSADTRGRLYKEEEHPYSSFTSGTATGLSIAPPSGG